MLNTVLFDMGGTLEDIWNNQETQAKAMDALQKTLRAHGLEPGCSPEEFDRRVMAGLKEYKRWSEGLELEKKPEEIWPDYYLKEFGFDREKLIPITEELANLWEVTYYHRELRGDVLETLEALKARGYHIGIISNNASLYNVFNMLEEYGIRGCMEDVTVSSVTGYRKPHPEIFRISLRQMQTTAENCVYVGDTISRDIIGAKQAGFGKAVQIVSALSAQKDAATAADAEKPDLVIQNLLDHDPLAGSDQPRYAHRRSPAILRNVRSVFLNERSVTLGQEPSAEQSIIVVQRREAQLNTEKSGCTSQACIRFCIAK